MYCFNNCGKNSAEMERKMELKFADRMKEFEEGIFQVLNEKKNELLAQGRTVYNL